MGLEEDIGKIKRDTDAETARQRAEIRRLTDGQDMPNAEVELGLEACALLRSRSIPTVTPIGITTATGGHRYLWKVSPADRQPVWVISRHDITPRLLRGVVINHFGVNGPILLSASGQWMTLWRGKGNTKNFTGVGSIRALRVGQMLSDRNWQQDMSLWMGHDGQVVYKTPVYDNPRRLFTQEVKGFLSELLG